MNINLNDNLTDEEIDQLVKTRNELTLKIDSHFKKKKIAKINNNKKYIGKCYKDTRAMDHITYMKVIGVVMNSEYRVNVIAFETPFKFFADAPDSTVCGDELIWTEDFGLFCFDIVHGEGRVIDNLEEISSEEWLKALDDCVVKIRCY